MPPAGAGSLSCTVNTNGVRPMSPSSSTTLATLIAGRPGPAHCAVGVAVLRGAAAAMSKSLVSLPVSVQPPPLRMAALTADSAPVGFGQLAEPKPTKSTMPAPLGQVVPSGSVVLLASSTFPLLPLIVSVPTASGVGNGVVPPVP